MRSEVMPRADAEDELEALVVQMFEAYQTPIRTYLYILVEEWEQAHDLAQDTFLQLYRTRQLLPQVENRRAWLYRMATNLALQKLRRRRRFTWLPWSKAEETIQLHWTELEEDILRRDAVGRCLAQIPSHYRIPLILYSYHGFRTREIAEMLGIGESATRVRLHRARQMFEKAYEQEVGNESTSAD